MANQVDTQAVLSGLQVNKSALTFYADILKGWHKQAGSKPTDAMLYVPHLLGKRPGVEALHIAMTLRPEGCTVAQFCLAGSCGPANNYRRALVKAGWFTATVEGKPYAFKLALTAKGADKLAKAQASLDAQATVQQPQAKPAVKATVKPKGKAKAKKAKALPVDLATAPDATGYAEPPVIGGIDAQHDQVTQTDLSALAQHFNS